MSFKRRSFSSPNLYRSSRSFLHHSVKVTQDWKSKLDWLLQIHPGFLYGSYFLFLFIPYFPNFSLYLLLTSPQVPRLIKVGASLLSLFFSLFLNLWVGKILWDFLF